MDKESSRTFLREESKVSNVTSVESKGQNNDSRKCAGCLKTTKYVSALAIIGAVLFTVLFIMCVVGFLFLYNNIKRLDEDREDLKAKQSQSYKFQNQNVELPTTSSRSNFKGSRTITKSRNSGQFGSPSSRNMLFSSKSVSFGCS